MRSLTLKPLSLLVALSLPTATVLAAGETPAGDTSVDTSNWRCKFCEFEEGISGFVDFGFGSVSEDSFKFGEYTGRNEQGGYVIGNAELRSRSEDAGYWDLSVSDIGLDGRELRVEVGKQGTYKLSFGYDELPHFISDSVSTPFRGVGSDSLTLPAGWVRAGSTGTMTALDSSLRTTELETQRKRTSLGITFNSDSTWEYAVKARHETKEGTMRTAGAFAINSAAQLVMPVDYVTDQVDVAASYAGTRLQARVAYYGSTFRNGNEALTWENPFTGPPGVDAGQLATAPDNEFHQIMAALGYQFSASTRATVDVAFGRMTQDQTFLAPTLNGSLAVPALPRSSLDGRVDTLNANARLTSDVSDRLRLNAAYSYNDRDNKTPQEDYPWVSGDTTVNTPRTNLPYSFTQSALKLSADYRPEPRFKTSLGVDLDSRERTFQEAEETEETSIWGQITSRTQDGTHFTLKIAHADRSVSNYKAVPEIDPPENPLLRKYNMSDRERDSIGARTDVPFGESAQVGLNISYSKDNYPDSDIGLTDGDDLAVGADATFGLGKRTNLLLFWNHEQLTSKQAGTQTFSTPDWTAQSKDTLDTAGIGVKHALIENKLDVGADFSHTRGRGEITITPSGAPSSFPDLTTRLSTIKLYADYQLGKSLSLHGAYQYEHYRTEDWSLDDVDPDTTSNVLNFGEDSPSYNVSVYTLFARYRF